MRSQTLTSATTRVRSIRIILLLFFGVLAARAGQLSVINPEASKHGDRQIHAWITLPGARGLILDRDHTELALSIDAPSVYVLPKLIEDRKRTLGKLAEILDVDRARLERRVGERTGFTFLARWISAEQAERIEAEALEGVGLEREPRRTYPAGRLAAPLLGFVNIDGRGVRGIEQMVDLWLQGEPRAVAVQRDARGRLLCSGPLNPRASAGGDVVLSIDSGLQAQAEAALAAAVEEHQALGGLVIAVDPKTGDLLSLAEYPGFDPNEFRQTDYETTRSRAFLDAVEPGSTLKAFVVAAALEASVIDTTSQFDTGEGWMRLPGKTIRDHHPYGVIDAAAVLRLSSNVGAVQIAQRLGPESHHRALRDFGFGSRSRSGFPTESPGLMRAWRNWKQLDHATVAFGQGVSVTPIQLTMALAALANQGERMRPRLVIARRRALGEWESLSPIRAGRTVSPETAQRVLGMLETVVSGQGTGRRAALAGVRVAGKTGTAQVLDEETGRYSSTRYTAWFMGVAPVENPEVAIVVALYEPQGKQHTGGAVAAPLFAKVAAAQLARRGIITRPEPIPAQPIPTLIVEHEEIETAPAPEIAAAPAPETEAAPVKTRPAEVALEAAASEAPQEPTPNRAPASPAMAARDSSQLRIVLVPDFHGQNMDTAKRKAARESLDLRVLGGRAGQVVDQSPAAGTIVGGKERTIVLRFGPARGEG